MVKHHAKVLAHACADVSSRLLLAAFHDYCLLKFLIVTFSVYSPGKSCNKFIRFSLSAPVAYKESQCPPFSALPCSPPQQTRHSYWHHQSFSTVHLNLWCSSPNFSVTTKSAHSLIPFKSNYQSTQSASVSRVWIWVCSVKPHHQMHKI